MMLKSETINRLLIANDSHERLEAFVEVLLNEISKNDEPWEKQGRNILLALQNNNAHDLLVALCGWSATSIAEKAGIIRDECEEFRSEEDTFDGFLTVIFDDDSYCYNECNCQVNPKTHEVFDFDPSVFVHRGSAAVKSVAVRIEPVADYHYFDCIEAAEMPEDETAFWYKPSYLKNSTGLQIST